MKYFLESCIFTLLAISLFLANATPSYANEAALVEKCDAGNMVMCEDLMRFFGAGGAGDNPVKWAIYAEKACNLKSGGACNNLGVAWSKGMIGAQTTLPKVTPTTRRHAIFRTASAASTSPTCIVSAKASCRPQARIRELRQGVRTRRGKGLHRTRHHVLRGQGRAAEHPHDQDAVRKGLQTRKRAGLQESRHSARAPKIDRWKTNEPKLPRPAG